MADKFLIKCRLYKSSDMIYFSQLDLAKILERALRRSGLPTCYTEGFNPRVKLSFGRALKLGVEGTEEVTFYFSHPIEPLQLINRLQPQLPEGLKLAC
ncbi:MAG: TIGR03936 family radical SAM-associated protein [Candidatus Omnitrophica bacterium]|nr:TIGR03936 family radical SAM-associated protein [Candidatus Omnitrophota bacterium]MCM8830848.1 TIGR03936 family radical SAM-associated protein [Candidatus Omnitrophota bacterium]